MTLTRPRARRNSLDWWFPLLPIVRHYSAAVARRDFIAGLTVALFTIPQAMAYALIAGFPPSVGITTAIVASILGAAFGSSEFLVNGPTNAISVVLGATLAAQAAPGHAIEQIVIITLLTGIIQCIVAAFRLGTLFALEPRTGRRLPAPFITVVVVSVAAFFAPGAGPKLVKDIQPIAREIPHLVRPVLRFPDVFGLLGTALAVSVIGSVEAIAIGKLLATRVGHPFSASRQLVGEGVCNIGAALVGGFASSGSFTRTAVIFRACTARSSVRASSTCSGATRCSGTSRRCSPLPTRRSAMQRLALRRRRDVDPLSFPRIKRRRGLLPDHDDGVKVIRPRFGGELAKQPGGDAAECSQLPGIQQRPG